MPPKSLVEQLKGSVKSLIPERFHYLGDEYYARLTAPLHYGNAVRCAACGGRFRHFLRWYGAGPPIRCPRCRALTRHRLLRFYLRHRTDLYRRPHRLLHVAPEKFLQRHLQRQRNVQYTSADLHSPLAMLKLDLTQVPLPDHSFTAILCNHVLEHIPDDHAAMRELHRLLEPGGWAILMVPLRMDADTYEDFSITDPLERERHFGQHDHVRVYGRDYVQRLESVGFKVRLDRFAERFTPRQAARYGIDRTELVPIVRRPE